MDFSLRKMEPVIIGFELEATCLSNLSMNLSHVEKSDFVRRSHMAKEMMMHFIEDIHCKYEFMKALKKKKYITKKMKASMLVCLTISYRCCSTTSKAELRTLKYH